MKQTTIGYAMILIFIASCSNVKKDTGIDFIPGTYIKEINQEFSRGKDTLVIQVLDKEVGSYTITRKTSYQQQIDGKKFTPKYQVHTSVAIYDPGTKQLREQNKETVFTFSQEKRIVMTGASKYDKVE